MPDAYSTRCGARHLAFKVTQHNGRIHLRLSGVRTWDFKEAYRWKIVSFDLNALSGTTEMGGKSIAPP